MPRESLHGRTCGVSRDGGRARTCRDSRCACCKQCTMHVVRVICGWLQGGRARTHRAGRRVWFSAKQPTSSLLRCLAACGTVWRHGCHHRALSVRILSVWVSRADMATVRASTDGFTACPAGGEGTVPSID
ncbi:hypothetical protein XarbCFBP8152_04020 [Xanthomonas arboricola]|nr:hypothetical protein XarbCFBP8152_04020 [Xanthomonas arboricola]